MEKYIHIATFNYPSELAVVKSVLESNAINCYVKDELTIQTHNFYSNAIGGIKLEVQYEDCKKAISILTETGNKNYLTIDTEPSEEAFKKKNKINKLLKTIISIVVGVAIIFILIVIILSFTS